MAENTLARGPAAEAMVGRRIGLMGRITRRGDGVHTGAPGEALVFADEFLAGGGLFGVRLRASARERPESASNL